MQPNYETLNSVREKDQKYSPQATVNIFENSQDSIELYEDDDIFVQPHVSDSKLDIYNKIALRNLKKEFSISFIDAIREDDFEFGKDTRADILFRKILGINSTVGFIWLNDLFLENFAEPSILIGILRIVSRYENFESESICQTMALAALSHEDIEVKESGIRVFENQANLSSLHILKSIDTQIPWLQEYISTVISDIENGL